MGEEALLVPPTPSAAVVAAAAAAAQRHNSGRAPFPSCLSVALYKYVISVKST